MRPYNSSHTLASSIQLLAWLWCLFVMLGCNPAKKQLDSASLSHDTPVTIQDRLSRSVTFTFTPKRIVSLSPETTELLFAIDAGALLVGATEFCNYPELARSIPRVGSGPVGTVSLEAILSKQPDLVLCRFNTHQPLIDSLERLQMPVLAIGPESFQELCEEAQWLGKVVNRPAQADQLVRSLASRAEALKSRAQRAIRRLGKNSIGSNVSASDSAERAKVFYQVWADPLMSASKGSFIDDLLGMAQLANIVHDVAGRYPQISPELVAQRNPDVILVPLLPNMPLDLQSILERPGWQQVLAVKNKRIYAIDSDTVSRCGPRMLDALQQIIETVYGLDYAEVQQ